MGFRHPTSQSVNPRSLEWDWRSEEGRDLTGVGLAAAKLFRDTGYERRTQWLHGIGSSSIKSPPPRKYLGAHWLIAKCNVPLLCLVWLGNYTYSLSLLLVPFNWVQSRGIKSLQEVYLIDTNLFIDKDIWSRTERESQHVDIFIDWMNDGDGWTFLW